MFHLFKWLGGNPNNGSININVDLPGFKLNGLINQDFINGNHDKTMNGGRSNVVSDVKADDIDSANEHKVLVESMNHVENKNTEVKMVDHERQKTKVKKPKQERNSQIKYFYTNSSKQRVFIHAYDYNAQNGIAIYGAVCFTPEPNDRDAAKQVNTKQKQPTREQKFEIRRQALSRFIRYPIQLKLKRGLPLSAVREFIDEARVKKGCYDKQKRLVTMEKSKDIVRYFYSNSSARRIFTHAFTFNPFNGEIKFGASCWRPSPNKTDVFEKSIQRTYALQRLDNNPVVVMSDKPRDGLIKFDDILKVIEIQRAKVGCCAKILSDDNENEQKLEGKYEEKQPQEAKHEEKQIQKAEKFSMEQVSKQINLTALHAKSDEKEINLYDVYQNQKKVQTNV